MEATKLSQKKTIAILVGSELAPNEERLIYNLSNLLTDSFNIMVFGTREKYHNLSQLRQIHCDTKNQSSFFGYFAYAFHFYGAVKKYKPDILVQLNSPMTRGPIVSVVSKITGIPYSLRIPGDKLDIYKYERGLKKIRALIENNVVGMILLKRAKHIILVGNHISSSIRPALNDKQTVQNILQPMDYAPFQRIASKEQIRDILHLPINKRIVLFVGRISHEKGADILEEIIRETNKVSTNHLFVIIGEGRYKQSISTLENTKCVGMVPFMKISDYYLAADLLVFPSRREGVPNVILESLICGLPIACSDAGEMPFLVSKTCNSVNDYVEKILDEEYGSEPTEIINSLLNPNFLKQQYLDFFVSILNIQQHSKFQ